MSWIIGDWKKHIDMTNNLCLMGFRGLNRMRKLGLLKKQMSINLYKFYAGCLYISHVLTRFPTDTLCIIIVLLMVHSMFNCCVVLLYCEDYY